MPGQPPLAERVASLETWRDEHRCQHNREEQSQEISFNRKTVIVAAIIGFIGMVFSAFLGAGVGYLLSVL